MKNEGTLFVILKKNNCELRGKYISEEKIDSLILKNFQITEVTGSSALKIGDTFSLTENEIKYRPHYYKHE